MTKPILIFLHIPKTAGTTMRQLLRRLYGDGFQVGGLERGDDRFPTDEMLANAENFLKDKDVYTHHMVFGLHAYLNRPHKYLTFLREPIKRSISHFNYFTRLGEHVQWYPIVQRGIRAFHEDGSIRWRNMQTRFLAGRQAIAKQELDESDIEQAKRTLRDNIELLGLVEEFDLSILYFQSKLDWPRPVYLKSNQSKRILKEKTLSYSDLNAEEKQILEYYNRYDLELYDYGKQLFQQRLNASSIDFESRSRIFAFHNRLYYVRTVAQNKLRAVLKSKL